MEGISSSLCIPDDMIEESFSTSDVNPSPSSLHLQPKSLRSLANFTKAPTIATTSSTSSGSDTRDVLDMQTAGAGNHNIPSAEPELQHGETTFVALESDLGTLFAPPRPQQFSNSSEYYPAPPSSLSMSFSRSDFEQELHQIKDKEMETRRELVEMKDRELNSQHKIKQLQSTNNQLELDNIDLSEEVDKLAKENKSLKEDSDLQVQDIQCTVQDLKLNLKEKEDDVGELKCFSVHSMHVLLDINRCTY